jgi:hypothetical protein
MMLGSANCRVTHRDKHHVEFEHGTYLTQTATLMPKRGMIMLSETADGTQVAYDIALAGFARAWLIFFGIAFFWLIFPPIIVYHAMVVHPRAFVENLLNGAGAA